MRVAFLAIGILLPLGAEAQHARKDHRVALIFTTAPVSEMAAPNPTHPNPRALLRALNALGHVHGQNLTYLPRSAEGQFERLADILRELISLKVDVIVASDDVTARRAREVAPTVPTVVIFLGDPVESGLIASLAQPGGNITGLTRTTGPEIEGKRMQLLKEAFPNLRRVSFLGRDQEWKSPSGQSTQATAQTLGVTLLHAKHSPSDYSEAFSGIARDQPDALFVAESTPNFAHRKLIADFAMKNRLPGMYSSKEFVNAGGLMSYGADLPDLYHRIAVYVDKILKGAKPGTLPVERPAKFEFVINLRTARAIGFSIPTPVLMRADQVIE